MNAVQRWMDLTNGAVQHWMDMTDGALQHWIDLTNGAVQHWMDLNNGAVQHWMDLTDGAVQHWMDLTDGPRYGPRRSSRPHRLRRQQEGGGVMFSAGIIGDESVGPFRVPEGVKLTAFSYIVSKQNEHTWFKMRSLSFRKKMVFMHDNAPSHAAKLNHAC